jgi:hypothetical protein
VKARRVWFAACDGGIYELNLSGRFSKLYQATSALHAIADTPDGELWAVGANGLVLRSTTDAPALWSTIAVNTSEELRGVFGASRDDVWIVGGTGLVIHFENGVQRTERVGTSSLNGVWQDSNRAVWVVGGSGTILERGAAGWTKHEGVAVGDLVAIGGRDTDELWIAGADAAFLYRHQNSWRTLASNSSGLLRGVWASDDQVWAAGSDGILGVNGSEIRGGTLASRRAESDQRRLRTALEISGARLVRVGRR